MATATFEYTFQDEKAEVVQELLSAARLMHIRHKNLARPSVVLKARLSSYCDVYGRTYWQASFGELIATGETPEEAFGNFDDAWQGLDD